MVELGCFDQPTLASLGIVGLAPSSLHVPGLLANHALPLWGVPGIGHVGVMLFFVHTSLVLMMSLARMESTDGRISGASFFVRRFFRIYPLAILTVLVCVAWRVPPHFEGVYVSPTGLSIAASLLLVQNLFHTPQILSPLWSLPFEVQMYLALPLLYLLARRVKTWTGAAALMAFGFLVWWAEHRLAILLHYESVLQFAPFFFMGVTAFALFRIHPPRWGGGKFVITVLALILLRCLAVRLVRTYRFEWVEWILFATFALLLPRFRDIASPSVRRSVRLVARYSYGIYLAHIPIMWFSFQILSSRPAWLQIVIFAILMAALPVALYHALEEPLIRFGVRVAARTARAPRLVAAAAQS